MFSGAHVVLYSGDPEADRVFLRDVLGFRGVDAGEGWLIFKLPPAEVPFFSSGERRPRAAYNAGQSGIKAGSTMKPLVKDVSSSTERWRSFCASIPVGDRAEALGRRFARGASSEFQASSDAGLDA
jgi:catechol 2,3-dioxygenase-like lactoylglutathione lyase family enzyme